MAAVPAESFRIDATKQHWSLNLEKIPEIRRKNHVLPERGRRHAERG